MVIIKACKGNYYLGECVIIIIVLVKDLILIIKL